MGGDPNEENSGSAPFAIDTMRMHAAVIRSHNFCYIHADDYTALCHPYNHSANSSNYDFQYAPRNNRPV